MITDAVLTLKAFADLTAWRRIAVTGMDALTWLNDLVTADVLSLRPGLSQRCLLLDDNGGLRADFTIAVPGSTVMLVQDPAQPRSILDLLTPYTEGTDVEMEDRSHGVSLFSFPLRPAAPDLGGTAYYSPSCLGPGGADLTCLPEDHDRLRTSLAKSFLLASTDDLEAWRIAAGRARMGVDAFEGDLPQEAGLTAALTPGKTRYLGCDAMAAIDETTPLRVVVAALRTDQPVSPGDKLLVGGVSAGELTSVSATEDGVLALARVWWDARTGPFVTEGGVTLAPRSPA
ncbi:MAG: hypothetical protein NVSMB32_12360 [Actinomycetota bacterium]